MVRLLGVEACSSDVTDNNATRAKETAKDEERISEGKRKNKR